MSHNPRLADKNYPYPNARVTSIQTEEGTTNYSYACQSNISQISKPSTSSGTDESIDFTYDGTLLTSITQTGQLNQSIDYTYNNDFNPTSMTYASQTENYTYNDDGEPTQIGTYTITRENKNRKVTLTDGNYGQVTKINRYGELHRQQDNVIRIKLFRNQLGQIVKKVEKFQGQRKKVYHYTYDERGRLTEVKERRHIVEAYTYDSNGNRQSATVYGKTITASYTLDDNLVVYGQNTYIYDEDGYLVEKTTPQGTTTYTYGTLGELLEVITPTKTITYTHNANNQRVAKLIDGAVVEKYLWADLTTLLATYDVNDNLVQRFEYANGRMPVVMTDANNTKYYLHYDQVGSLRAVTDTSHNIVKEITYDTFGNILSDSNPNFKVPFGFAGGLYDADTKLTRFGYRDYDAYTGKWTAKDPIGFAGGDSNLYGYVLQDPVKFFDPDGLINRSGGHGHNRNYPSISSMTQANQLANQSSRDAENSGLPGLGNGLADAYRHCLWSCSMTYELGSFDAWLYGTGHEVWDNELTPYEESRMDLRNNCTGRELGSDNSPFNCKTKCLRALQDGKLVTAPVTTQGITY